MRLICIIFTLSTSAILWGEGYLVKEGRPELLNKELDSGKKPENATIVRDPIVTGEIKKPTNIKKKKKKKTKLLRESVHDFKSIAIDGRRSKPRVRFDLPTLPFKRVDESYTIPAAERLMESK